MNNSKCMTSFKSYCCYKNETELYGYGVPFAMLAILTKHDNASECDLRTFILFYYDMLRRTGATKREEEKDYLVRVFNNVQN